MRVRDSGPCMGCNKRHVACHNDCADYKEWRKKFEEEKETTVKNAMDMTIFKAYLRNRYSKKEF